MAARVGKARGNRRKPEASASSARADERPALRGFTTLNSDIPLAARWKILGMNAPPGKRRSATPKKKGAPRTASRTSSRASKR